MAQLSKEDRAAAGHVGNFQSKVGALEALRAAVLDLREEQAGGNIALRIPETDDLLVILRVNPIEARELEAMLASAASVPVANNPPDAAPSSSFGALRKGLAASSAGHLLAVGLDVRPVLGELRQLGDANPRRLAKLLFEHQVVLGRRFGAETQRESPSLCRARRPR